MHAVFLHVFADFLGSLIVVTSALILWKVPNNGQWKLYVDPALRYRFGRAISELFYTP